MKRLKTIALLFLAAMMLACYLSPIKVQAAGKLAAPNVTCTSELKTMYLSWKKVHGANGYIVYRKTMNEKWKKVAKTSKLSFIDMTTMLFKDDIEVSYRVRAFSKDKKGKVKYGNYSDVIDWKIPRTVNAPKDVYKNIGASVKLIGEEYEKNGCYIIEDTFGDPYVAIGVEYATDYYLDFYMIDYNNSYYTHLIYNEDGSVELYYSEFDYQSESESDDAIKNMSYTETIDPQNYTYGMKIPADKYELSFDENESEKQKFLERARKRLDNFLEGAVEVMVDKFFNCDLHNIGFEKLD